jgi:hypothetical protein
MKREEVTETGGLLLASDDDLSASAFFLRNLLVVTVTGNCVIKIVGAEVRQGPVEN